MKAERGVRAQIKGTQRAVQVAGDANQLLAGTLRTGDHVDVVGAWQIDGDNIQVSRVIARDALVLSAPTVAKAGATPSTSNNYSAQLRVTDADSQKLEWIVGNGKDWRLEIRPPADATNSPRWHETSTTMLKDGAGQR